MSKIIIGVMGPGNDAPAEVCSNAYQLGRLIAQQGWIVLTGGRGVGVMDAACRGAKHENGITIGILPTSDRKGMSDAVDIPILTGMGQARNAINVLSSDAVVVCGMGTGTASEVSLALKAQKHVILLNPDKNSQTFFEGLLAERIFVAENPQEAIAIVKTILEVMV